MSNITPGTKALKKALSRFKEPKSPLRKNAREALENLKQTHAALRECFETRARKTAAAAEQATSGSLAAAAEYVQWSKKLLEERRREGEDPAFAESELAIAESLYRNVATASEMTKSAIEEANTFDNKLWNWFDQLTEIVATGLIEGRVADIAIVSANGTLITLGIIGGPMIMALAAAASGILLAGDLVARLRKGKAADTEEARLEAATLLIEAANKIGAQWLKTINVAT